MGIVERVVNKLGSMPQRNRESPVARVVTDAFNAPDIPDAPDTRKRDLIERALRSQRPDFLKVESVADAALAEPKATGALSDAPIARKWELIEQALRSQRPDYLKDESLADAALAEPKAAPAVTDAPDTPDTHKWELSEQELHSQRPDYLKDESLADAALAEPKAARAEGISPKVLKVDLDRLRQQQMVTPHAERTTMAECFRRIKRHILGNMFDAAGKPGATAATNLIMVTSALPGEGKTFCAVNLAISMAMELDRTVLLVDADVAKPAIMSALGLEGGQPGLMDLLAVGSTDLADVLWRTNIGKLSILPAGTRNANATEMLASGAMHTLVQEMAERYKDRVIIFDSPPILIASEASVLATQMSQVILVVAAGDTTEAALKEALQRLESCEQVSLMLNRGRAPGSGYGYRGYGYGNHA